MSKPSAIQKPSIYQPFGVDNSAREISQYYNEYSATGGTITFVPYNQYSYYNFVNPLATNLTIILDDKISQICFTTNILLQTDGTSVTVTIKNITGDTLYTQDLSGTNNYLITGIYNGIDYSFETVGEIGPQGVDGAQGPVGPQGAVGSQGAVGPQGSISSPVATAMTFSSTVAFGSNTYYALSGTASLSSGTVTINNANVKANSIIYSDYMSGVAQSLGIGSVGNIRVSAQTANTSFIVISETSAGITNSTDNSNIQWIIFN